MCRAARCPARRGRSRWPRARCRTGGGARRRRCTGGRPGRAPGLWGRGMSGCLSARTRGRRTPGRRSPRVWRWRPPPWRPGRPAAASRRGRRRPPPPAAGANPAASACCPSPCPPPAPPWSSPARATRRARFLQSRAAFGAVPGPGRAGAGHAAPEGGVVRGDRHGEGARPVEGHGGPPLAGRRRRPRRGPGGQGQPERPVAPEHRRPVPARRSRSHLQVVAEEGRAAHVGGEAVVQAAGPLAVAAEEDLPRATAPRRPGPATARSGPPASTRRWRSRAPAPTGGPRRRPPRRGPRGGRRGRRRPRWPPPCAAPPARRVPPPPPRPPGPPPPGRLPWPPGRRSSPHRRTASGGDSSRRRRTVRRPPSRSTLRRTWPSTRARPAPSRPPGWRGDPRPGW